MTRKQVGWLLLLLAGAALFYGLKLPHAFSLSVIETERERLAAIVQSHPLPAAVLFFLLYLVVAAFPLMPHIPMSLAAGALFGFWIGTLLVSFASSLGATIAFLLARSLFQEPLERRFRDRMEPIQAGVERNGATFLFSLRLVPFVPFFMVNLLMGLTRIPARTFYLVSQAGMLPATALFVNAGSAWGHGIRPETVMTPRVLVSLSLLALFPWAARAAVRKIGADPSRGTWKKPRRFDRNLIVIGAGSAGLVTSYLAAALRARVTLIEGGRMGGDCLNTGCVPSKAILKSAKVAHMSRKAEDFGVTVRDVDVDFSRVMERVREVIGTVAPHDSEERYRTLGVEVIHGWGRLVTPWEVEVDGRRMSARSIVIAAGASPRIPGIPGIRGDAPIYTSETIWSLKERPRRLVVLGGGPIGCELGQAFSRLGSQVSIVDRNRRLLKKEDPEVGELLETVFSEEGIEVLTETQPLRVESEEGEFRLVANQKGEEKALPFDALLLALGRVPRTKGYGLEEIGVRISGDGTIGTDPFLATNYPHIFACGDVAGPYQFTHAASHQAGYVAINALFGNLKRFRANYSSLPWCTFTDPEVGRVGLSEEEARDQGIPFEVTRFDFRELDRALAESSFSGFVKVLTVPGKDRILGATIIGERAGDLLSEFTLAMRHGLGLEKILSTIHAYPTWPEAARSVAGVWKRAHAPEALLEWSRWYHALRRRM